MSFEEKSIAAGKEIHYYAQAPGEGPEFKANTFADILVNKKTNADIVLIKHPEIRGTARVMDRARDRALQLSQVTTKEHNPGLGVISLGEQSLRRDD
ncbi:hypothetical protein VPNG_08468 [Cytospora leucostoma]|uniref:Uncharacterized protein n=1 Tax=Cytospora leucostoma TaxID=1230097 RepID=A0A423WRC2_9PEZI|nr:hypothetical protein VPNG_08468 [Cytospora leucostoma]